MGLLPEPELWKPEPEIRDRVSELAERIDGDYGGEEIRLLGVLRGCFVFMADLMRALKSPVRCQFINLYFKDSSGGQAPIRDIEEAVFYPSYDLTGKSVILLTDIVDTGIVMDHIRSHILMRGGKSVRLAAVIDKPSLRRVDLPAQYVAFDYQGDDFIVGYGLDYQDRFRQLPYLAKLPSALR